MRCRCRLNGRRSYRASYAPNRRSRGFGSSRRRRFARKKSGRSDPSAVALTNIGQALDREDVNAVLIATPGFLHRDMLLQVRERDLPILCEKPLTPDAQSSWEILEAEQRLGKKRIQVGFHASLRYGIPTPPGYHYVWGTRGALDASLLAPSSRSTAKF
jgi:predicted dehydrogenase